MYGINWSQPSTIVVDRHRIDADPDLTFQFDANRDPDHHPQVLHSVLENMGNFLTFIHSLQC